MKSNKMQKSKPNSQDSMLVEATQFSIGPLPPPEEFAAYESTLPGSCERILQMAEREQQHRHEMDNKILENDSTLVKIKSGNLEIEKQYASMTSRNSLLGIISAATIGMGAVFGGIYFGINANATAGTVISVVGLSSIIGAFIYGTRRQK